MSTSCPSPPAPAGLELPGFEALIAELSSRFVHLPASDVDREIEDALCRVCGPLGIDLAVLWQWAVAVPGAFAPTHFYPVPAVRPSTLPSVQDYPWTAQQILAGRIVTFSSLDELPAEAVVDREAARVGGIQSNLTLPLAVGGEPPVGALAFNALREEREWPEALVQRLELVAQVFTNALARKRNEQSLRESQERLELAAESAAAGIWVLDPVTGVFWTNARARAIFGYSPDEIVTTDRVLASVHPEDRDRVRGAIERSRNTTEFVDLLYRIVLPEDGRVRWISSRGRLQRGSAGEPERLTGLSIDVTAQRAAEEAFRAAEEVNRATFEQAAVGIAHVGTDGRWLRVNDKLCAIIGYPREELLRLTFQDITHPDDLETDLSRLRQVLRGELATYSMEKRYFRRNRSLVWANLTVSLVRNAAGKPLHFISVVEDISERKRAEEALLASQARLVAGADLAGLAFYEVDFVEKACFADERFRDLCGIPADARGLEALELWIARLHPDDRQRVMALRREMHEGKLERLNIEYRYLQPAAGERWFHHVGRVTTRDASGFVVRTFGAIRDITDRRQREEALRQSYAEIERLKDRLQAESDYLKAEIDTVQPQGRITGNSPAIRKVLRLVEQVAPVNTSVLVRGETGTGKELVAEAIHRLSPRKDRVMVKVNCAALPSGLVESELFGREKGAFTGAMTRQAGRFEAADGSTLFLDEVGEISLEVQAKLLRVLETGEFERLGSSRTLKVDVRLVAATNRDLTEQIRKGRFRQDLYYRLNVFPIQVPPLRERAEDIPLLVWTFLEQFSSRMGKKITQVPRRTMEALQRQAWPGNVRELRNVIEHAAIVTTGDTLKVSDLGEAEPAVAAQQTLEASERDLILRALESRGWCVKGPRGAAGALGLKPSTLYSRMKKLGIRPPRARGDA